MMQFQTKAIMMTVLSSLLCSQTARGFSTIASRNVARTSATASTSTARFMSSDKDGPMPYDEDKMPFYALGTNLAMQVGGQGNFKTLLEDDELEIVLDAFCQNLKGINTVDERTVLTTYGQQLVRFWETARNQS